MALKHRIVYLERRERDREAPRRCPECGCDGDNSERRFTVTFGESPGPERCPHCGRKLVFRVTFDRAG